MHLLKTLLFCALLSFNNQLLTVDAVDADDFEVYGFDFRSDGDLEMNGRLLVPDDYDPQQSYPIVLLYHGQGEIGTDNRKQVERNISHLVAAAREHDFFIYAPQLQSSGWGQAPMENAMHALGHVILDYNIDRQRIYTSGISLGGGGVWQGIAQYSEALAAHSTVAGVLGGAVGAHFVDEPIWMFHAENDPTVGVGTSRSRVNDVLIENGQPTVDFPLSDNDGSPYYSDGTAYLESGDFRYAEYPNGGHSIWDKVYRQSFLYDWMLAQRNENDWAIGDSFLIDLGNKSFDTVDSEGARWNSTSFGYHDTVGPTILFPRQVDSGRVQAIVELLDPFAGHTQSSYHEDSLYDADISNDGWVTTSNATESNGAGFIGFSGLLPGGVYQVEVYAYQSNDDGGRGRMTRYMIGTQVRDLDAANNLTDQAVFDAVSADSSGRFELKVFPTPDSGSRYGHISALKVTLLAGPNGPINSPPVVSAGSDRTLTMPQGGTVVADLNGSVSDDGLPAGSLSLQWSLIDAPVGAVADWSTTTNATTSVTLHQAGEYTFQLTANDTEAVSRDEVTIVVKLEGGALGGEVVFSQDFNSSDILADYTADVDPSIGQFEDLSANADGGSWQISNGQLRHVRDGGSGGAGFQRVTELGEPMGFVRMQFKLSIENTSSYRDIGTFILGDWDTVIGDNASGSNAAKAFGLTIKARGAGQYYLRLFHSSGNEDTENLPTSSTPISVIWYTNMSGEAQIYNGVDGYGHSLPNNASDLWLDDVLVLDDVPRPGNYTATEINAFRLLCSTDQAITLTLDDLMLVNQANEIVAVSPYQTWLEQWFTEAERADPVIVDAESDPDRDGLVNLLEYYAGSDPSSAGGGALPLLRIDGAGLQLNRDPGKTDFTVELWSSAQLSDDWEMLAESVGGAPFVSTDAQAIRISEQGGDPIQVEIEDARRSGVAPAEQLFYQLRYLLPD